MTENIGWAELGVRPDASGFGRTLDRALVPHMDQAGRSAGARFSSGMRRAIGVGGGLALFGGAASFLTSSVKLEAEFSKTFAQIRVATNASADQIKTLDALAVKLGKDTIFSANDASQAMLELAKNGISPATIQAGALKSALTLAAAGGVDLTEAATTMGNALNAFSLRGKQAKSVSAALAGAANASSASVGSLAEGLQQSAATAHDVGLSVQETTGILAAFANAGISGSDAGTSLKTMLSKLAPQTDRAQTAMEEYGLSFVKANGEFKSAVQIAAQLNDGLGDLSASERSTALNTIFGSDARRAATILTKEGAAGLRDYIKATSDQGAAERMAKASMSGTAGAIEQLKGSWETLKLEFGKEIAPVAADFLNSLANQADDAAPKLQAFGAWIRDDGVPALKKLGHFAGNAAGATKDLIGFLNDLPDPAKYAGLIALVGGVATAKLRGGGGALGGAGRALGLSAPVKVFVTNPGFGGASTSTGAGGKGSGRGTAAALLGLPILDELSGGKASAVALHPLRELGAEFSMPFTSKGRKELFGPSIDEVTKQLIDSAKYWHDYEFNGVSVFRAIDTAIDNATPMLKRYQKVLDGTPRQIKTWVGISGYEKAIGQINTLTAGIDALAGRGLDSGVPYLHGGTNSSGVNVNIGTVHVKDGRDLLNKSQQAALGGRRTP